MSKCDTADTTSFSNEELKTHDRSDSTATDEPFNRLFSSSITSFENREKRSVDANVHNERTSVIRSLVIEQS